MWLLIVPVSIALPFAAIALARARRFRLRGRRMIVGEMADFVRLLGDPRTAREVAFTGPHRCDEDRTHDTMFTARHGHRQLSFILDTSRMRIRWWVLYELYAPDTSERTLRVEADLIDRAIPTASIQALLKAARGEATAAAAPEPDPPLERRIDPFEAVEPDQTAPAVQA